MKILVLTFDGCPNAVPAVQRVEQAVEQLGLFGLTLLSTCHRILIEDVALFSCCTMIAQAVIESVDPINNRVVRLSISPNSIQSVEPEAAVATLD